MTMETPAFTSQVIKWEDRPKRKEGVSFLERFLDDPTIRRRPRSPGKAEWMKRRGLDPEAAFPIKPKQETPDT